MAFENKAFMSAQTERIPTSVKWAAGQVGVKDFIKIAYQARKKHFGAQEYKQINGAVEVISGQAAKSGEKPYNYKAKMGLTMNPWVLAARQILREVPLQEYLVARQEAGELELGNNTRQIQTMEQTEGYEKELEKALNRQQDLVRDVNLTNAVVEAVKVSLA